MNKRKTKRHNKRLEVKFRADSSGPAGLDGMSRGYMKDISERGVFIKCRKPLPMGEMLDITATLPGGVNARLRGMVMRHVRGVSSTSRSLNGMGLEIIAYDKFYSHFLHTVIGDFKDPDLSMYASSLCEAIEGFTDDDTAKPTISSESPKSRPDSKVEESAATAEEAQQKKPQKSIIIACVSCGAKNRIPKSRISANPKCGRCQMFLIIGAG